MDILSQLQSQASGFQEEANRGASAIQNFDMDQVIQHGQDEAYRMGRAQLDAMVGQETVNALHGSLPVVYRGVRAIADRVNGLPRTPEEALARAKTRLAPPTENQTASSNIGRSTELQNFAEDPISSDIPSDISGASSRFALPANQQGFNTQNAIRFNRPTRLGGGDRTIAGGSEENSDNPFGLVRSSRQSYGLDSGGRSYKATIDSEGNMGISTEAGQPANFGEFQSRASRATPDELQIRATLDRDQPSMGETSLGKIQGLRPDVPEEGDMFSQGAGNKAANVRFQQASAIQDAKDAQEAANVADIKGNEFLPNIDDIQAGRNPYANVKSTGESGVRTVAKAPEPDIPEPDIADEPYITQPPATAVAPEPTPQTYVRPGTSYSVKSKLQTVPEDEPPAPAVDSRANVNDFYNDSQPINARAQRIPPPIQQADTPADTPAGGADTPAGGAGIDASDISKLQGLNRQLDLSSSTSVDSPVAKAGTSTTGTSTGSTTTTDTGTDAGTTATEDSVVAKTATQALETTGEQVVEKTATEAIAAAIPGVGELLGVGLLLGSLVGIGEGLAHMGERKPPPIQPAGNAAMQTSFDSSPVIDSSQFHTL